MARKSQRNIYTDSSIWDEVDEFADKKRIKFNAAVEILLREGLKHPIKKELIPA